MHLDAQRLLALDPYLFPVLSPAALLPISTRIELIVSLVHERAATPHRTLPNSLRDVSFAVSEIETGGASPAYTIERLRGPLALALLCFSSANMTFLRGAVVGFGLWLSMMLTRAGTVDCLTNDTLCDDAPVYLCFFSSKACPFLCPRGGIWLSRVVEGPRVGRQFSIYFSMLDFKITTIVELLLE